MFVHYDIPCRHIDHSGNVLAESFNFNSINWDWNLCSNCSLCALNTLCLDNIHPSQMFHSDICAKDKLQFLNEYHNQMNVWSLGQLTVSLEDTFLQRGQRFALVPTSPCFRPAGIDGFIQLSALNCKPRVVIEYVQIGISQTETHIIWISSLIISTSFVMSDDGRCQAHHHRPLNRRAHLDNLQDNKEQHPHRLRGQVRDQLLRRVPWQLLHKRLNQLLQGAAATPLRLHRDLQLDLRQTRSLSQINKLRKR